MIKLCSPAIIYVIFSLTQIIIDTYKTLYNTAIMKIFVMIMVTILLNILCERGLSVISWMIVFIPFIFMTVIVTILLYIFGLDAATGSINSQCKNTSNTSNTSNKVNVDSSGNIIIYNPKYDPINNPIYYNSPNLIIPNPGNSRTNNSIITSQPVTIDNLISSSPAYQS
jgi:hypothetical protein